MHQSSTGRLKYFIDLLAFTKREGKILAVINCVGAVDTVRSHVFHALPEIPSIPVSWWIVIVLATTLWFVAESAYNTRQSLTQQLARKLAEGGRGGYVSVARGSGLATVEGGRGGTVDGLAFGGQGGGGSAHGEFVDLQMQGGLGGSAQTPDGRGGKATPPLPALASETPHVWAAGRGGAGQNTAEYERRLKILYEIRRQYMSAMPDTAPYILAGVDTISPAWINARLQAIGEKWNVALEQGGYVLPPL